MPSQWTDFISDAPEPPEFATGGMRRSSKAIKLKGAFSGEGIFYTLNRVKHGCGFQISCHFSFSHTACQMKHFIHCPKSAKIYVDRVEQNVPILLESVECLAMPAEATGESVSFMPTGVEPSSSDVKPFPAPPAVDRPANVPEETSGDLVRADESDYEPSIKADSQEGKVEEVAKTLYHSLTHYPKSKHCEICMRAKMTSRYHRKCGDPDPDETPPLHFGHVAP